VSKLQASPVPERGCFAKRSSHQAVSLGRPELEGLAEPVMPIGQAEPRGSAQMPLIRT
jgi:hypothetical protein